jgi:acetyl esterase/lipase
MHSPLRLSFVSFLGGSLLPGVLDSCGADQAAPAPRSGSPVAEVYAARVPPPTLSGVRYGENQRHILDFWKAESKSRTPLVFVIHGGAWVAGSKERVDRFVDVKALLNAGISVVAINVSVRPSPSTAVCSGK